MLASINPLIMAQELFYSRHASYTGRADSLAISLPSGVVLVLLWGDKRDWAGILYDSRTTTTCGVSIGFPAPRGWLDGTPFCGR